MCVYALYLFTSEFGGWVWFPCTLISPQHTLTSWRKQIEPDECRTDQRICSYHLVCRLSGGFLFGFLWSFKTFAGFLWGAVNWIQGGWKAVRKVRVTIVLPCQHLLRKHVYCACLFESLLQLYLLILWRQDFSSVTMAQCANIDQYLPIIKRMFKFYILKLQIYIYSKLNKSRIILNTLLCFQQHFYFIVI